MLLKYYTKGEQSPKSHKYSGKMTQAIFIKTAKVEMVAVDDKRRQLNVSGVLRILGVSKSEKTVGNYMKELGIKAKYIKPYTTINSDFSFKLCSSCVYQNKVMNNLG